MTDFITCPADLAFSVRRNLHTSRLVCRTLVPVTALPMLCPSCGSRVA
jgi:hypothetical protein